MIDETKGLLSDRLHMGVPDTNGQTLLSRAWEHFRRNRLAEANRLCLELLDASGKRGPVLHLLALLRQREGLLSEAVALLRDAITVSPFTPEFHSNLGGLLGELGKAEESIACLQTAIHLRPDFAHAHSNLAVTLIRLNRIDEAIAAGQESLRLRPSDPTTHTNLGRALLLAGHWKEGFAAYEWRIQQEPAQYSKKRMCPVWDGSPIAGRTILLRAEQGLGDTIQFSRYVRVLTNLGCRVVLDVQPQIYQLLNCLCGPSIDITCGSSAKADVEAWLLSIPHRVSTTIETIPKGVPYVHADAQLMERWAGELPPAKDGLRIGIAWQGNPTFYSDRQRSIPLRCFEPLARLPRVKLVSLQKAHGSEQLMGFTARNRVLDLAPGLDHGSGRAFTDTAAAMMNLDLVVTSDTAIAHLAGALGVPVWVALPFAPDWRWLLDREDSPWYPTMRLFRQKRPGDWDEVFDRIARAIEPLTNCDTMKSGPINIEIGAGELADRMTILRIKCGRFNDGERPAHLQEEFLRLQSEWQRVCPAASPLIESLVSALASANQSLWDVEDKLRQCESGQSFGEGFVELSRSVYRLNDHRSRLKRQIDRLLGSRFIETKVYATAEPIGSDDRRQTSSISTGNPSSLAEAIRAFEQGRTADAEQLCRDLLNVEPDNPRAIHLLGLIAHGRRDHATAIDWMRRSVELDETIAAFHNNLGEALRASGRLDDAIRSYQEAVRLQPSYAEAHYNLGLVYRHQNRCAEAIISYEQAIALRPDVPDFHLNLGIALLLSGDWNPGFAEYEWRWKTQNSESLARAATVPLWRGEDLAGKRIFVHSEQGFGDSIQFARYISSLERRGAKVTVEVQPELKRLFETLRGVTKLIVRGDEPGEFDYHCPMLSLPRAFATTPLTVPAEVPYLVPDPDRVAVWRQKLNGTRERLLKVGIVWAGRPTHKNDHNRSLPLRLLAPLADVENVRLISLQQGEAANQQEPNLPIERVGPLTVFAETAAVIANLDLVISVDTAVAHLTGAIGRPVWLLNPFVTDWRWLLDREDSPWYPTMRIFRQATPENWEAVIERIQEALRDRTLNGAKATT